MEQRHPWIGVDEGTVEVRVLQDTAFAGTCMLMPLRYADGVAGP